VPSNQDKWSSTVLRFPMVVKLLNYLSSQPGIVVAIWWNCGLHCWWIHSFHRFNLQISEGGWGGYAERAYFPRPFAVCDLV